jgi:hypothetical protein
MRNLSSDPIVFNSFKFQEFQVLRFHNLGSWIPRLRVLRFQNLGFKAFDVGIKVPLFWD